MSYQDFLLPQEKRCAIISYKHGIYELSHELHNDLDLESEEIGKYQESVSTL